MVSSGRTTRFFWGILFAVFFNLSLTGCGPAEIEKIPTFPAKGKVLVDDKPVAGVRVMFYPVNPQPNQIPASGTTDEQGNFTVWTYDSQDGIPAGDYVLTFEWYPTPPAPEKGKMPALGSEKDMLNGRYADMSKSEFKVTVTADKETVVPDISLKTK